MGTLFTLVRSLPVIPFLSEGTKDVSSATFSVFHFITVNMSYEVKPRSWIKFYLDFVHIFFMLTSLVIKW